MSDALERLRKRQRPTVPSRDVTLIPTSQDTSTSRHLELENIETEETDPKTPPDAEDLLSPNAFRTSYVDSKTAASPSDSRASQTPEPLIQNSESLDTSIPRYLEEESLKITTQPLETKQSTLRLEAKLSNRLQALCRKNNICREVLLEAMFEYCEADQDVLEQVLASAEEKNEQRQQIANHKRAQSMMKRFGQM